jgi:hypothetical protein
MGDLTEATREMIVDRALIDPDIMFFMGDLEAVCDFGLSFPVTSCNQLCRSLFYQRINF